MRLINTMHTLIGRTETQKLFGAIAANIYIYSVQLLRCV